LRDPLGSLTPGDRGTAFGQFQWHSARVEDILRNTGIDVRSAGFADQLKAFRWEAEHGAGGGHIWEALKHAKSREEAIWLLVHGFERSLNQGSDAALRLGFADRYGRSIKDGAAAPSPHAAVNWDAGPAWSALNASLPVSPNSVDNPSSAPPDLRRSSNGIGSGWPRRFAQYLTAPKIIRRMIWSFSSIGSARNFSRQALPPSIERTASGE